MNVEAKNNIIVKKRSLKNTVFVFEYFFRHYGDDDGACILILTFTRTVLRAFNSQTRQLSRIIQHSSRLRLGVCCQIVAYDV